MFEEKQHLYNTDEIRSYANGRLNIAKVVEGCINGEAWRMFSALHRKKRIEILNRDDYDTLENFRADRAGLKFLTDIMAEFEGYAHDADSAVQMIEELDRLEETTPLNTLELPTIEEN